MLKLFYRLTGANKSLQPVAPAPVEETPVDLLVKNAALDVGGPLDGGETLDVDTPLVGGEALDGGEVLNGGQAFDGGEAENEPNVVREEAVEVRGSKGYERRGGRKRKAYLEEADNENGTGKETQEAGENGLQNETTVEATQKEAPEQDAEGLRMEAEDPITENVISEEEKEKEYVVSDPEKQDEDSNENHKPEPLFNKITEEDKGDARHETEHSETSVTEENISERDVQTATVDSSERDAEIRETNDKLESSVEHLAVPKSKDYLNSSMSSSTSFLPVFHPATQEEEIPLHIRQNVVPNVKISDLCSQPNRKKIPPINKSSPEMDGSDHEMMNGLPHRTAIPIVALPRPIRGFNNELNPIEAKPLIRQFLNPIDNLEISNHDTYNFYRRPSSQGEFRGRTLGKLKDTQRRATSEPVNAKHSHRRRVAFPVDNFIPGKDLSSQASRNRALATSYKKAQHRSSVTFLMQNPELLGSAPHTAPGSLTGGPHSGYHQSHSLSPATHPVTSIRDKNRLPPIGYPHYPSGHKQHSSGKSSLNSQREELEREFLRNRNPTAPVYQQTLPPQKPSRNDSLDRRNLKNKLVYESNILPSTGKNSLKKNPQVRKPIRGHIRDFEGDPETRSISRAEELFIASFHPKTALRSHSQPFDSRAGREVGPSAAPSRVPRASSTPLVGGWSSNLQSSSPGNYLRLEQGQGSRTMSYLSRSPQPYGGYSSDGGYGGGSSYGGAGYGGGYAAPTAYGAAGYGQSSPYGGYPSSTSPTYDAGRRRSLGYEAASPTTGYPQRSSSVEYDMNGPYSRQSQMDPYDDGKTAKQRLIEDLDFQIEEKKRLEQQKKEKERYEDYLIEQNIERQQKQMEEEYLNEQRVKQIKEEQRRKKQESHLAYLQNIEQQIPGGGHQVSRGKGTPGSREQTPPVHSYDVNPDSQYSTYERTPVQGKGSYEFDTATALDPKFKPPQTRKPEPLPPTINIQSQKDRRDTPPISRNTNTNPGTSGTGSKAAPTNTKPGTSGNGSKPAPTNTKQPEAKLESNHSSEFRASNADVRPPPKEVGQSYKPVARPAETKEAVEPSYKPVVHPADTKGKTDQKGVSNPNNSKLPSKNTEEAKDGKRRRLPPDDSKFDFGLDLDKAAKNTLQVQKSPNPFFDSEPGRRRKTPDLRSSQQQQQKPSKYINPPTPGTVPKSPITHTSSGSGPGLTPRISMDSEVQTPGSYKVNSETQASSDARNMGAQTSYQARENGVQTYEEEFEPLKPVTPPVPPKPFNWKINLDKSTSDLKLKDAKGSAEGIQSFEKQHKDFASQLKAMKKDLKKEKDDNDDDSPAANSRSDSRGGHDSGDGGGGDGTDSPGATSGTPRGGQNKLINNLIDLDGTDRTVINRYLNKNGGRSRVGTGYTPSTGDRKRIGTPESVKDDEGREDSQDTGDDADNDNWTESNDFLKRNDSTLNLDASDKSVLHNFVDRQRKK